MGARLRTIRELKNLTQAALGDLIGVGVTTIAGWESGRNQLDVVALGEAAKVLKFSTDFVILDDLGSLPFDLAVKVQQQRRAEMGAAEPGDPPLRRRRLKAPLVRDIPDPPGVGGRRTLHDPGEDFIPGRKNT